MIFIIGYWPVEWDQNAQLNVCYANQTNHFKLPAGAEQVNKYLNVYIVVYFILNLLI